MAKRMALCAIWALLCLTPIAAGGAKTLGSSPKKTSIEEPRPALWVIKDTDTTIYLFGTTHALPKGFQWQSPLLNRVIAEADELVVESLQTEQTNTRTEAAVDDAINPVVENRPIIDRVSPDKRGPLKRAMARTDFPPQFYDAMPTWMASLVLAVEDMAKDGADRAEGVEAKLLEAFKARQCSIRAVEEGSVILRQLQALPEKAQQRMLENTLEDIERTKPGTIAEADRAWAKGDMSLLDAQFTPQALGPELYDVLIVRRNRTWADWLAERMKKPGTILFAVGAGHYAGPDSLRHMLHARGFFVERLN